jgi:Spy/CpxP family protein refolding chaperone
MLGGRVVIKFKELHRLLDEGYFDRVKRFKEKIRQEVEKWEEMRQKDLELMISFTNDEESLLEW